MASEKGIQDTTNDKYKLIAKARAMRHDELAAKVESHILDCFDPDCSLCDMGASGSLIDDDSAPDKGRKGAGENIDIVGKAAQKLIDKNNRSGKMAG